VQLEGGPVSGVPPEFRAGELDRCHRSLLARPLSSTLTDPSGPRRGGPVLDEVDPSGPRRGGPVLDEVDPSGPRQGGPVLDEVDLS